MTILIAVMLGVAWVLIINRPKSRQRKPRRIIGFGRSSHSRDRKPHTEISSVKAILDAYKASRYDDVISNAPAILAALGAETADSDSDTSGQWRHRVQLVLGHSLFEVGRYSEAIPQLVEGLNGAASDDLAGRARFEHCLGYAYLTTGQVAEARSIFTTLLEDEDLDPTVRDGVRRNLNQLSSGDLDFKSPSVTD